MSKLRIGNLSVRDFRCFSEATIDLSADIVAIYGRNGVGKTGIFDAIEFALFGLIYRLDGAKGDVDYISRVGCTGDSSVRIDLRSHSRSEWVETSWDRANHTINGLRGSMSCTNHRDLLYDFLVDKSRLSPRREVKAIRDLFHSSLMLSQYSIRNFVEPYKPNDRAKTLANLAGVAHIQRSKDKAEQVVNLAERQHSIRQNELAEVVGTIEEFTRQLAGLEGRRKELDNKLAGTRPTTEDLLRALKDANISDNASLPETETVATFARAAQARCIARSEQVLRRKEQFSPLDSGLSGYLEQTKKLERTTNEKEECRKKLRLLESEKKGSIWQSVPRQAPFLNFLTKLQS